MSTQPTDAQAAIAESNKQFMAAFERGDASGVTACYTSDGQIMPPGTGIVTGKANIEAFWTVTMEIGVGRVTLETLEVDQQGETAVEVGKAMLYSAGGDEIDNASYLVVWKADGNEWKMHRDIWSSNVPPPQA